MTSRTSSSSARRSRRTSIFTVLVCFCSVLPFATRSAALTCDYTVTTLADSGTGSLRAGLADAAATDICFGVQGTITVLSPLQIAQSMTITGSSAVTISGSSQVQIFVVSPSAATDIITITSLNLTAGFATLSLNQPGGGALWIQQGNVSLSGVTMTSNSASSGGAIYNQGSLQILGGSFTGNQATEGGAIYNVSGGSLSITQGTLFSANSASQDGGAIYNAGSTTITQALFTANQANGPAGTPSPSCGGALCNVSAANITESTFAGNTSTGSGGAIENFGAATLILNNDTVSTNTARLLGSGLDIESTAIPVINNTVIAGNSAISGAANSDCNGCTENGSANLIGVTSNLGPLANNGGPTQSMMPLPGGSAINAGLASITIDDFDQRGFSRYNTSGGVDIGAVQSHYSSVAYVTQPSNAFLNQAITPAVAAQVVETDGTVTNYPLGVPITVSLLDSLGNPVTGVLTGTLTQTPVNTAGVIAAVFPDLAANTAGTYKLFATDAISGNSSSADPTYNATSNAFQVSAITVASVVIQESANPITFGQSETLTAVVTGTDGKPFSGGTAAFTVDNASVGSAAVVNGSAGLTIASLTGGAHQIGVTYTNTTTNQSLTNVASLTVNKAVPALIWPAPAAIYTSTALSGAQLDASATGVNGLALSGTFAYNPPAGSTLPSGTQTLSTTFTPTDVVDYSTATAQVTIQVNTPIAGTVAIQESANPITFGQAETLTAVVTGTDGKPVTGGTATFTVDGILIGTATISNGSGSITSSAVSAGTHQIAVSYTSTGLTQPLTTSAALVVNKATPVLAWPTPAAIFTSTPISATQLNAVATGVTGAVLPGSFVYNPAAGTTLTAGSHTLLATFTPTDSTDYNTNTAQVTIQVTAPIANTIAIQESANPITFGQSETFTVIVNGSDGKPFSGGNANFTSDGVAIGSATVVSGAASIIATSLAPGMHQIGVSYTDSSLTQALTTSATITVNKATPVITWSSPASIYNTTALSNTQLDALATGVTKATLPGTFVYSPAAGTMLPAGTQKLTTTFTPNDTTDYTTATAQVTILVANSPINISSISPNSTPLGTNPLSITITGGGFTSTSVLEVNGSAVATSVKSATSLAAIIPTADLSTAGALSLSVYDTATKLSSNTIQFPVTAPPANVTLSLSSATGSGEQPSLTIGLNSSYPVALSGTLTLTFAPYGNGVDDPAIQFSTGGRTETFTVPANSTTSPQVAFQTGTVAGTITVTLTLSAGGVNVTPAGLAPATLIIAPAAPVITSVAFTNGSDGLITVVVNGFSNTREMTQADFVFSGAGVSALKMSTMNLPIGDLFGTWYASTASDQYGSEFTYTQHFQLSKPDSGITAVSVTLSNSIGTSGSAKSQ